MGWQYQSTKCSGKKFTVSFTNIVVFVLISLIIPYFLIAFPLSFLVQMRLPGILQQKEYWECRVIFIFTAAIIGIIVAIVDALIFNKIIYQTLFILGYIYK